VPPVALTPPLALVPPALLLPPAAFVLATVVFAVDAEVPPVLLVPPLVVLLVPPIALVPPIPDVASVAPIPPEAAPPLWVELPPCAPPIAAVDELELVVDPPEAELLEEGTEAPPCSEVEPMPPDWEQAITNAAIEQTGKRRCRLKCMATQDSTSQDRRPPPSRATRAA
jgi:hypothetical protein